MIKELPENTCFLVAIFKKELDTIWPLYSQPLHELTSTDSISILELNIDFQRS